MSQQPPFTWRHFQPEIILLCVRWSLRYALSSRALEEMLLERGRSVDHTTISRSRPARRSRTGPTLPATSQSHHRFLARRRDVCEGERRLDGPVARRGCGGEPAGVLVACDPGYHGGQAVFLESPGCVPPDDATDLHGEQQGGVPQDPKPSAKPPVPFQSRVNCGTARTSPTGSNQTTASSSDWSSWGWASSRLRPPGARCKETRGCT